MPRRRTFASDILSFAHSMLTALRHPACACQQRRLSGHGQPLTDASDPIQAPGGSRGTPGLHAVQRAMQCREKPNEPESPDFRPGLLAYAERQARTVPYRFTSRQAL